MQKTNPEAPDFRVASGLFPGYLFLRKSHTLRSKWLKLFKFSYLEYFWSMSFSCTVFGYTSVLRWSLPALMIVRKIADSIEPLFSRDKFFLLICHKCPRLQLL